MFWSRSSWTKYCNETEIVKGARGRGRASEGENVNMRYIVNQDGVPVDGYMAATVRRIAREFWKGLSRAGVAPQKWMTDVDLETAKKFHLEMQTQFEELRLCDGGWKVDQVAIDYYSGWRNSQEEKGIFNATEEENTPIDVSDNEEDTSSADRRRKDKTTAKRKAKANQSDQVPATKKQKKEAAKPAVVEKGKAKAKPVQIKDPLYVLFTIFIIHAENTYIVQPFW
jgi:nucleoid-associated protein YgaU